MQKPKRTYQKPLKIEMDFEEALERYAGVDPKELAEIDPHHRKPKIKTAPKDKRDTKG